MVGTTRNPMTMPTCRNRGRGMDAVSRGRAPTPAGGFARRRIVRPVAFAILPMIIPRILPMILPRILPMILAMAGAMAGVTDARAGFFYERPFSLFDLRPLEDQLEIVERERELMAIDAWSRSVVAVDLARGETVLWSAVRGRVALAITDRRALAAVPGASGWTERQFGISESEPTRILIGDRVAMVVTDRRVLGFEGVSGSWSETDLGPREAVLLAGAGTNVAVAVTRTRVLGVAAARGGLFEQELGIREQVESLRVHGSFATATTRLRVLTFRAPDGSWQSTDLTFR